MIGLIALVRIIARGARSFARDERSRAVLFTAATLIAAGAVFYRQIENMSWIDSFYFTVITLTTVGYGDIAPETTAGKLFTMLYVLIGIGLLVTLVSETARHIVAGSKHADIGSTDPDGT